MISIYLNESLIALLIWTGLLGLVIGSFLNVVIYRLPIMMQRSWRRSCAQDILDCPDQLNPEDTAQFNLAHPDSHCPACQHPIHALENIPVLSYLWQKARCKHCAKPISIRYPLVEAFTALLSVVLAWHFGFGWQLGAALLLTWSLIALSLIDYDTQLLPDEITLPLLWLGLLVNLFGVFTAIDHAVIGAMTGYLILWLVFWGFKLVTGKDGMGYGDFKLLAVFGAWLGWQYLLLILLLSSCVAAVLGSLWILFGQHEKTKPIPFGPYLATAGWIALIWGAGINHWYLGQVVMP